MRWLVWLPHWEIVISMPQVFTRYRSVGSSSGVVATRILWVYGLKFLSLQGFAAHLNEIITRLSVFRKMQAEKRLKMLFARSVFGFSVACMKDFGCDFEV